ncbi:MAG: DUF3784 domain-containing protein [Clostridia bacterium]|nr:DUF3784 domain-containing protein [Clostridia bacterium]
MIIELVTYTGVGILCLIFAFLLIKKHKINLIHDYHHRNVTKKDIPAYTKQIGKGLLLIGAGCVATGIVNFVFKTHCGIAAFVVCSAAGFALTHKAQKKYNGSWFS